MRSLLLLLLTIPATAQWQLQDSHSTASLRGIHSIGNSIAWASGTEGTILRTTDQGKTWQHCTTPPGAEKLDFRGVQAFDAQTAIVMSSGKGDLSRLYKTIDGCKTWKLMFTNPDPDGFWDALHTERSEEGVEMLLVGDPVNGKFATFQSTFGATKLDKFDPGGLAALPGEGLFAASNSSFDIETQALTLVFGTGGPKGARVLVNCDSCNDEPPWKAMLLTGFVKGPAAGVFSVSHHQRKWVVVGGDYTAPNGNASNAAISEDGAKTWRISTTYPHGYRSAVAYSAAHKAWITVGPNGTDASNDDGRNWHPLAPTAAGTPDEDKNWNALSLPFVVGPKGRIGLLRPEALNP